MSVYFPTVEQADTAAQIIALGAPDLADPIERALTRARARRNVDITPEAPHG